MNTTTKIWHYYSKKENNFPYIIKELEIPEDN